jgi:hypothetical protein
MQLNRNSWTVALLIVAAIPLSACTKVTEGEASAPQPFKIVKIQGTDANRLELTKKAADRIGIQTAPIGETTGADGVTAEKVVDYAALIYDAEGHAFVYTNPDPLVFVRQSITVDSIDGDRVLFSDGPPAGTVVVTVGVPELFGIDSGVGGNE